MSDRLAEARREGLREVAATMRLQMDSPYVTLINRDAAVVLDIIDSLAPAGHIHEGQWCHPCVQHGSDATFAGIAEAEAVRLAPAGLDVERTP